MSLEKPCRAGDQAVGCIKDHRSSERDSGWSKRVLQAQRPRVSVPFSCPRCSFQLDNESSITDTIFQFTTEELSLLPLRDLAVFHNGDTSHQFGFTVGPVCFS